MSQLDIDRLRAEIDSLRARLEETTAQLTATAAAHNGEVDALVEGHAPDGIAAFRRGPTHSGDRRDEGGACRAA